MSPLKQKESRFIPILSYIILFIFYFTSFEHRYSVGKYPSFFINSQTILVFMVMSGLLGNNIVRFSPRILSMYDDYKNRNQDRLINTIVEAMKMQKDDQK